ncbi:Leucoanthocyanidin reductase family protein [Hibiscus syriacus]|uniref:Leucoanthocyanidin reductase family protein n=1 Tax=Hibiscus syriacus TaxID=106335 RepID=A0A6A3CM11_HIBSY|nr:Leucoanthocyanidin reductase family protein [Hibiscus syriacus]
MFVETHEELAKLELIDIITKLGLGDLFPHETQRALEAVLSSNKKTKNGEEDLYIIALRFKLLRLHGYDVSQGMYVFKGAFSITKCTEIKGLLELYEASFLAFEDENWFDVKWRIAVYENNENVDKRLLELAKLNFNSVQATLQKDLREISRWWRNLGIMEHLNFTRDRLAESFFCAVGLAYEPQYSCFRKCLTKITTMILIIDDVYDVYGSLQELEQFTEAVDRWDSSKIQKLPECMKICFQALHDITNEIAYDIQELNGWNVQAILHLRKAWTGFCKALFVEAKWYNEGYSPSLEEYLSNALVSSGGTVISVHSMLSLGTDEMIDLLGKSEDLVYNISIITRLCNDLGTSTTEKERGDAPSSILCYMREMNVSEKEAEGHIKKMISKTWMKINRQCLRSRSPDLLVPSSFVKVTVNVARMVHCLYQFGDGFGVQDQQTRSHILSVLIEPFHLDCP